MFSLIPWKKKQNELSPATTLADPLERRIVQFRDEFNSLVDRFWENDWGNAFGSLSWGLDLDENENEFVVHAEAPGFEAQDFDVQVRGNYLTIRAEHKDEEKNDKNGSYYRYGQYQRTVTLPHGAQTDNIDARYHSGVLELHIPKGEEAKGKRITVSAN